MSRNSRSSLSVDKDGLVSYGGSSLFYLPANDPIAATPHYPFIQFQVSDKRIQVFLIVGARKTTSPVLEA